MRSLWFLLCAVSLAMLGGCPQDSDPPACITVDLACEPLYEPTFEEIFDRTLKPSCGVPGSSCHSAEGRQNGLAFADPDEAYDLLLGSDGRARVIPGDPGCSLILSRVESDDPGYQMPPGAPLSEAERCVIRQWIANGAPR